MAKATIDAGICGFITEVTAEQMEDGRTALTVESTCPHITQAFEELHEVEPFSEIGFYGGQMPTILTAHHQTCPHAACPVFSGVIKAVEISAGLALPKNVAITLEK